MRRRSLDEVADGLNDAIRVTADALRTGMFLAGGVSGFLSRIPTRSQMVMQKYNGRAWTSGDTDNDRLLANAFNPEQGRGASVSDYQNWANHLRGYAGRITMPDLAPHAHGLADEWNKMSSCETGPIRYLGTGRSWP